MDQANAKKFLHLASAESKEIEIDFDATVEPQSVEDIRKRKHLKILSEKYAKELANAPLIGAPVPRRAINEICPECKTEITDETLNYTINYYTRKRQPCPSCTPRIQHLIDTRRAATNYKRLYPDANVPKYGRNWSFENFPLSEGNASKADQVKLYTQANLEMIKDDEEAISLFIYGKQGVGKSSAAISAQRMYLEAGISALYVLFADYVDIIQKMTSYSFKPCDKDLWIEETCKNVTVLLLDDLGVEKPTPNGIVALYKLIEHRRVHGLVTIITSNNSLDDLIAQWRTVARQQDPSVITNAERIASRIKEQYTMIHFSGKSLRV